jgi:hypothetical protein
VAVAGGVELHLPAIHQRRGSAALGRDEPQNANGRHHGQSPGPVSRRHHLLQSGSPGVSLGDAVNNITARWSKNGHALHHSREFCRHGPGLQDSLAGELFLIITALLAVYIVLGILYESYIHPITILSTLPSAGVGAVLALMLFNIDLSIIASSASSCSSASSRRTES